MDSYFGLFSSFLGFLPLGLYFLVKGKRNKDLKLIAPFLFFTFFASLYEFIFTFLLGINVAVWFKVYSFLEFFVLMHYFYKLLEGRYKYMYYFFAVVYLVSFGFIVSEGKMDNFLEGDSYLQVIESAFVIISIILWMKYAFISRIMESLLKSPQFYFISGLLFYFSGTLFLFLLGDLILKEGNEAFLDSWMLNLFLNIIFKILLLLGIWKGRVK